MRYILKWRALNCATFKTLHFLLSIALSIRTYSIILRFVFVKASLF